MIRSHQRGFYCERCGYAVPLNELEPDAETKKWRHIKKICDKQPRS